MSAPMDALSHLLGNSMNWIADQPELKALGHGVGLAYDIATNAPPNTAYNIPMYDHEEDAKHGRTSSGPD